MLQHRGRTQLTNTDAVGRHCNELTLSLSNRNAELLCIVSGNEPKVLACSKGVLVLFYMGRVWGWE